MLELENIVCERAGTPVFSGLGVCLKPGSVLILKGPNGSGKTSLLKIIAGLLSPAEGLVKWNKESIRSNTHFIHSLLYIGHKSAIKQECSVGENLRFWAQMNDTGEMLAPAEHFFDLEDKLDVPTGQLSAGWQRRVGLARLLLSRANLWLLDEPTNFLDEEAVMLFTSLVETRVTQGGIVIIASHTMGSSFASHTLMMDDFR